jgi:hypothetical protein
MKIICLFYVVIFLVSCQAKDPAVESKEPIPYSEIQIKQCNFSADLRVCNIEGWAELRLKKLSESSGNQLPESTLNVLSLRSVYRLDQTQVDCLKNKFCNEVFK